MKKIKPLETLSQKEKKKASGQKKFEDGRSAIPNFIMLAKWLTTSEKIAVWYVVSRCNKGHKCFVKQKRMAAELGMSARTVWSALAKCRRRQLFSCKDQPWGMPNEYSPTKKLQTYVDGKMPKYGELRNVGQAASQPEHSLLYKKKQKKKENDTKEIKINDDAAVADVIEGSSTKKYGTETITITRNLPSLVEMYRKSNEKKRFPYAPRPGF